MVEMLLDHGADVNAVDKDGDTALHITLMMEHIQQRNLGEMVNDFVNFILSSFLCRST